MSKDDDGCAGLVFWAGAVIIALVLGDTYGAAAGFAFLGVTMMFFAFLSVCL